MKALQKNIIKEITKTKSRFISILAIIAISTGFFSGVKASSPSMLRTGENYFESKNLMDIRLVSTVGFDDDDIRAIKNHKDTVDVMPGYFSDQIVNINDADQVVRVYSLPEKTATNSKLINETIVNEGRLPMAEDECVLESYYYNVGGYKIGDSVIFNESNGNSKTKDVLRHTEYKIVGSVSTPLYITYQRGNTNIGSGSIAFFVMIEPSEFKSERYTNVYVTTTAGKDGLSPLTDEYKDMIADQKEDYSKLSEERIKIFNNTTYKDAKNKLSDAEKEYNDKKEEAEDQITENEKKLHDGESELQSKLTDGENKLSDGQKELENGKKELESAQKEYTDGIQSAKQKLTDAEKQYSSGKEEYTNAKHTYDSEMEKAQGQLDNAQSEYDTQYSLFYGTIKPQAETKLTLLKAAIDSCNEAIEKTENSVSELGKNVTLEGEAKKSLDEFKNKLSEYKSKLADYQKQYDDGMSQLSDGEKQLTEAKEKLSSAKLEFQQKKTEASDKLNDAQIKLDNAQSQLEIGKLEYNTAMTTGAFELQAAQSKVSQSEQELLSGRQELETQKASGLNLLKGSREKLITGKNDARIQLRDAEKKLKDARNSIDQMKNASWLIYDRDDNPGYSGLEEDALRVDNIAAVFPVFFLLVAALVSLTTMSRMVEERRTEIGTLKALGYSDTAIASKYFIYAFSASLLGSIIGAVAGIATMPFIILDTYSIMYTLPPTILVIPWDALAFSAGTGILCTCMVAVITCLGELKIKPATLMRPKAPKPGKRILLEYITPLWKRMNFTSKVTARNLFRYKARFLMTVIGVAGCTALIIGGLGLKDSIGVIADRQFRQITIYDEIFALSEPGTKDDNSYIMSKFHSDKRFKEAILVDQEWVNIKYGNGKQIDLRIVVGEDPQVFKKMFILRDRLSHDPVELDNNGIVINERLSQVIGKNVGDKVEFTLNDKKYTSVITDLTENYAGNYIYLTPQFYKKLTGNEVRYNVIYTQLTEEALADEHEISNEYMKMDEIITVSLLKDQLDAITSTLDSLNVIVLVLVFCAGLLAVVVLYNLTNINIAERVREIATIKVLGFYNLETANYIYRENIILALVGALAGLPLGKVFASFVVLEIQMDMVMFPQNVEPVSYIIGFLLTIVFAMFVNFAMYFKLRKISMVESLKSIE